MKEETIETLPGEVLQDIPAEINIPNGEGHRVAYVFTVKAEYIPKDKFYHQGIVYKVVKADPETAHDGYYNFLAKVELPKDTA